MTQRREAQSTEVYRALLRLARRAKISVVHGEDNSITTPFLFGQYLPAKHTAAHDWILSPSQRRRIKRARPAIVLSKDLTKDGAIATLAHELGHHLTRLVYSPSRLKKPASWRERVAAKRVGITRNPHHMTSRDELYAEVTGRYLRGQRLPSTLLRIASEITRVCVTGIVPIE